MQKKNAYLCFKGLRNDKLNAYAGNTYKISEETMECGNILGQNNGIAVVELPTAKAGRKFWFKTAGALPVGVNQIEIRPDGDMYSADSITEVVSGVTTLLPAGHSIISDVEGENQIIILQCNNDGVWSCIHNVGDWEQADRSFEVSITHHRNTQGLFIGSTGSSDTLNYQSLLLTLTVRNDSFVAPDPITDPFPNVSIADDLALMTIEESRYIDTNKIELELGDPDADEIIGTNLDKNLLIVTGATDILIGADSMTSGDAVIAGDITVDIAGLKAVDIDKTENEVDETFVVDVLNDTLRLDIASFPYYVTFGGDYDNLTVTSVTRTSATRLTVVSNGTIAYDTGIGSIFVSHNAFNGEIKNSLVSQRLYGTVTSA